MELVAENYKQTEVGIIPSDWEIRTIGSFTDVCAGGTPSTFVREYWNGNIRWMNSGELNLKTIYEVENRITELGLNNSATRFIPVNCLLIGLAGQGKTRGTVAINKVELCTNQSIAAIFPCDEVYYTFLYFNLDSRYHELRGLSTGDGGRGGLNLTIIKNLIISLPPTKAEQIAIATALSDADALISSLEKLIVKKRNIKQGAMQKLLQPKEGWEVKKLGEIGEFKNGINKGAEDFGFGYPFVNLMDVFGISKIKTNQHLELINSNESERRMYDLRKGDVLFIRSSVKPEGVGLTCLIESSLNETVFSGFIIRFRENGSLSDEFKEYCFSTSHFRKKVIASSSVSANTNINQDSLKNLILSFPKSKEEQTRIATILSDMDAEISALETKLEKYIKVKLGMMQNLLTGKIRLI